MGDGMTPGVQFFENESEYQLFEFSLAQKILNQELRVVKWFGNWSNYKKSIWPMHQIIFEDDAGQFWVLDKPSSLDFGRFYPVDSNQF